MRVNATLVGLIALVGATAVAFLHSRPGAHGAGRAEAALAAPSEPLAGGSKFESAAPLAKAPVDVVPPAPARAAESSSSPPLVAPNVIKPAPPPRASARAAPRSAAATAPTAERGSNGVPIFE